MFYLSLSIRLTNKPTKEINIMSFCPFTQKDCLQNCQLNFNGKCAIAVIAEQQYKIANEANNIANSQQSTANSVRQINQNKR